MGFYKNYKIGINSVYERKNNFFNKTILIFLVIILSISFVILGIIIGKIIYGIHRKIRVNELIDKYDYISDNNLNKDINKYSKYKINKKSSVNKENVNYLIEMKINRI